VAKRTRDLFVSTCFRPTPGHLNRRRESFLKGSAAIIALKLNLMEFLEVVT
jgi:hypothetical protein